MTNIVIPIEDMVWWNAKFLAERSVGGKIVLAFRLV